jgi:transcriptional regulator with XRE-family HTH domain
MLVLRGKSKKILKAVRDLMQERKLRYKDLARLLHTSLPSVKRWMISDDISFARLEEICSVLDVEVEDLIIRAIKTPAVLHKFTYEQEVFFSQNPSYLAYFFELKQGLSPAEIEKKHGVGRGTSKAALAKLESLELVRKRPSGKIEVIFSGSIHWNDHGPLGVTVSKCILKELAEHTLSQLGKPTELYMELWDRSLTQDQFLELQRDVRSLSKKYGQFSEDNRRFRQKSEYQSFACAFITDRWQAKVFSRVVKIG